tara:strand:- start:378 stop:1319 length:942 start_codon:yes stop_codon:yes gene_type:complete
MKSPLLDFKHYQVISMLAEKPQVVDVAVSLGITPSAVSHRIREAERRLGVQLFTLANKRLRMTPAGEHLAKACRASIFALKRTEEDACQIGREVRHTVRLSVEYYSSYFWLPEFLRHLGQSQPDIGLRVVATGSRSPVACLNDRSVDLIIVSGDSARNGAHLVHIFDDELLCVMAADHEFAGKEYVDLQKIAGVDSVPYTWIPDPNRAAVNQFHASQTYPNWNQSVDLPEVILEMVAAGLGTSVLAAWATKEAIKSGRVASARVGKKGVSIPWYAATRKDTSSDEELNKMVAEILADWCRDKGAFPVLTGSLG